MENQPAKRDAAAPVRSSRLGSNDWHEVSLEEIPENASARTSFSSSSRSRINTHVSSLSQMESSWEDIHPNSVPPLPKSRASSTGSYQTNSSEGKPHDFRTRLSEFLSPHSKASARARTNKENIAEEPEVSVSPKSCPPLHVSDADSAALRQREKSASGAPPSSVASAPIMPLLPAAEAKKGIIPKHLQAPRTRLTASESDSRDARALSAKGRRSMSGDSPLLRSAASARDLPGPKRTRKITLKQSRSIGIVGGEDFVMNPTSGDKFVSAIYSAWNNVKYGLHVKPRQHLSLKTPIWIFGEFYTTGNRGTEMDKKTEYAKFMHDFRSRFWFTYRRDFPTLTGSRLNSDSGWGCMLRSGQMMLAQALMLHFLRREWRWDDRNTRDQEAYHRRIIRWCGDTSTKEQLFGVHQLVTFGQKCGKKAGDWYGPGSVAHIVAKAMIAARNSNPLLSDIHVYVSQDCTIFKGDIADMRKRYFSSSERESAMIILVPVRLGAGRVNPVYMPCIKNLLTLKFSIGIIGGRPKHSLYFVGWQDNSLLYLDPHFCQDTVDMSERTFPLESFHCSVPRVLPTKSMDPSCTLGFYCRNTLEYEEFVEVIKDVQLKYCRDYPMFSFSDGKLSDYDRDGFDLRSFEAEGHIGDAPGVFFSEKKYASSSRDIEESSEYVVL